MSRFFPCCLVLRLPRVEIDRQGMLTHKSICGIEEGHHFELSIPHPITTSRATAGQSDQTAWGCAAPPRRGWDIKVGSAGACQPSFVNWTPINA